MTGTERILVVDDDPAVRELLKEYLELKGYVVITASTGAEAVTAVQEQRPRLILLDILMPGMDGLAILQRIRQIDPTVGVIMLTAVGDEEIAKEALRQGAYDYITKPVDLAYLELAVLAKLAHENYSLQGRHGAGGG
jgi:DNA-binding response OmpR family regulator